MVPGEARGAQSVGGVGSSKLRRKSVLGMGTLVSWGWAEQGLAFWVPSVLFCSRKN